MGFGVWGFGVWGLGFWGLGFGVWALITPVITVLIMPPKSSERVISTVYMGCEVPPYLGLRLYHVFL